MKTSTSVALVLTTLALSSTVAARPPKPPEADGPTCRSLAQGASTTRAAWGRASRTNGCFFFSGPGDLGRDDHLGTSARYERRGAQVTIRFGGLVFSGPVRGDRVVLRRVSDHEFGSTWRVTEVIDARFVQANGCTVLRGQYRYQECDTSRPQSCPGTCTIDAPVTFTAR